MKINPFFRIAVFLLVLSLLYLPYGCNKDDGGDTNIQNGKEPVAVFIADKTIAMVDDPVVFTDQSLNDPTSWLWDFGDGNTSDIQNPTHTYDVTGEYTIKLTAINEHGSGNEIKENYVVATDSEMSSFIDPRDGKVYKTVTINNQVWMAENLNYDTIGFSWVYDDEDTNAALYGRLYTWDAAKLVCPNGWHLPNDTTFTILINFLGGSDIAGGALKEAGFEHWDSPNTGATNSSGFTALAAGIRFLDSGDCAGLGSSARFWGSTGSTQGTGYTFSLGKSSMGTGISGTSVSYKALYVRCIKND